MNDTREKYVRERRVFDFDLWKKGVSYKKVLPVLVNLIRLKILNLKNSNTVCITKYSIFWSCYSNTQRFKKKIARWLTFLISFIISLGSSMDVVFMDHVNLRLLGLQSFSWASPCDETPALFWRWLLFSVWINYS